MLIGWRFRINYRIRTSDIDSVSSFHSGGQPRSNNDEEWKPSRKKPELFMRMLLKLFSVYLFAFSNCMRTHIHVSFDVPTKHVVKLCWCFFVCLFVFCCCFFLFVVVVFCCCCCCFFQHFIFYNWQKHFQTSSSWHIQYKSKHNSSISLTSFKCFRALWFLKTFFSQGFIYPARV